MDDELDFDASHPFREARSSGWLLVSRTELTME